MGLDDTGRAWFNRAVSSSLLIKEMAAHERPRERLLQIGAENLKHAELIALLLRTGLKGISALQVAEQLLKRFGSLGQLARASVDELRKQPGVGRDKAIALKAAFTLALKMAAELHGEEPLLDTPERVADYLRESGRHLQTEAFRVLLLNTRRRLIRVEELSTGTRDTLLVRPAEVFEAAIAAKASAIVVVHNHPSGDPAPREADIKVTRGLIRAGQLLKIDVLDHVILGRRTTERAKDYASLRELGYFYT